MNAKLLAVVTCGVASLGTLPAQDKMIFANPVPTRIETRHYGYDINLSGLQVECFLGGKRVSTLRISGGAPGAAVALLAADEPGQILIPGMGTLLVSPDAVAVYGVFDAAGVFERPVEIDRPELCGHSYFFQAVALKTMPPVERPDVSWRALGVELSMGLEVRFRYGNDQPALGYVGPRMTSIPCKDVGELIPTLWSVLLEFHPDGLLYALTDVQVVEVDAETSAIEVVLRRGDNGGDRAVLRELVALGPIVKPHVQVWVGVIEPGSSCLTYALASEIHTTY